MASTYSPNLAIQLIATGEQSGVWGTTTNTNLGTLLEQAISGYTTQAMADANQTITIPDGSTGVARNMFIECTGSLSAARLLLVPVNRKLYFIYNNTTGGFAVTVKVTGLTGISVANGRKMALVCNGTDIVAAVDYFISPTFVTPALGTPASGNLASCTAYPGTSALVTVGTLTGGATGAGFTVALGTSTLTGTLPDARMPALTGDVTTSVGAVATTIGVAKVTNAMLAGSIAASKLVGTDIVTVGTLTSGATGAGFTVVAPASTLSGSTLNSGVTASSLTSVGTLAGLTVTAGASIQGLTVGMGGGAGSTNTAVGASALGAAGAKYNNGSNFVAD